MSRKPVTSEEEPYRFLIWKTYKHSYYVRRGSDGEMGLITLIGSGLPPDVTKYRSEIDGVIVPWNWYEFRRVMLSERVQLQNVLQSMLQEAAEPQKSKPAADKKLVPAPLSAIRRVAGKARAVVNHAGDRTKLKDALVAKVAAGYSKQCAAEIVARYANAKNNPLKLEGLPYKSEVTDRIVMRISDSEK